MITPSRCVVGDSPSIQCEASFRTSVSRTRCVGPDIRSDLKQTGSDGNDPSLDIAKDAQHRFENRWTSSRLPRVIDASLSSCCD
jgi:hypothetical protein